VWTEEIESDAIFLCIIENIFFWNRCVHEALCKRLFANCMLVLKWRPSMKHWLVMKYRLFMNHRLVMVYRLGMKHWLVLKSRLFMNHRLVMV
jgi:hypothetical protein